MTHKANPQGDQKYLSLPHFLSPSAMNDLQSKLADAERHGGVLMLAAYCPETSFGVSVMVNKGVPFFWNLQGPMTPEQAQLFLEEQHRIAVASRGASH